jgi:hypothetical protein
MTDTRKILEDLVVRAFDNESRVWESLPRVSQTIMTTAGAKTVILPVGSVDNAEAAAARAHTTFARRVYMSWQDYTSATFGDTT